MNRRMADDNKLFREEFNVNTSSTVMAHELDQLLCAALFVHEYGNLWGCSG